MATNRKTTGEEKRYNDLPVLDKSVGVIDRPPKGEPGHVPCWWDKHGTTETGPRVGSTKIYRDRYDTIKWDK